MKYTKLVITPLPPLVFMISITRRVLFIWLAGSRLAEPMLKLPQVTSGELQGSSDVAMFVDDLSCDVYEMTPTTAIMIRKAASVASTAFLNAGRCGSVSGWRSV